MMKHLVSALLLSSIGLIACPMEGKCEHKDKTSCHEKCKKECPKGDTAKSCPHKENSQTKEHCDYHKSKEIKK